MSKTDYTFKELTRRATLEETFECVVNRIFPTVDVGDFIEEMI